MPLQVALVSSTRQRCRRSAPNRCSSRRGSDRAHPGWVVSWGRSRGGFECDLFTLSLRAPLRAGDGVARSSRAYTPAGSTTAPRWPVSAPHASQAFSSRGRQTHDQVWGAPSGYHHPARVRIHARWREGDHEPSATPAARPHASVCCRVAPITANATTKRTASAKRSGLTSGSATRLIDRLVEHGSVRRLAHSGSVTVHEAAHRTLEAMADRSTAERCVEIKARVLGQKVRIR